MKAMVGKAQVVALIWCLGSAYGHDLPPVVVYGQYDPAIGTTDSASQGSISPDVMLNRALPRPAEVLEMIPGMVVTQHSGDGKANQYFLRGMNLDHGTDFATSVNGVPVNMPTHAHGQGYSDLNILIPELISRIDYRKGPYFASNGDFSSAGSADIHYRTRLERPFASMSLGQRGYVRGVAAGSQDIAPGITLLSAVETLNNDGSWTQPEALRKRNALFTLSGGTTAQAWHTSLSVYSARWNATDQVPQRLIDAGSYLGQPFGRFDSLDPSDGAQTRRLSLSGQWQRSANDQLSVVQWYAIGYDLDLYSNFTYTLDRPSDQLGQSDHRTVLGAHAFNTWATRFDSGQTMLNTLGVQIRQDNIRAGLYDAQQRLRMATVRDDQVRQAQWGWYAQNEWPWSDWLRTVAGLRADQIHAQVTSLAGADNSGIASAFKLSPKLTAILGPWRHTELFFNAGHGFHSNDARGMTARVDPRSGLPIDRAPGLVSSRGQELGVRTEIIANLHSTLAIWQLDFDSELVYVGDAGTTEAGRPSRRTGVEWGNRWTPLERLQFDANMAWTRPRYRNTDPSGNRIVNAAEHVANLSLGIRHWGPWSGSIGWRYIGSAPLTENNSVRSAPSLTTHLRVARQVSSDVLVAVDVLNLTDHKNNDISYFYTSRVVGEPVWGVDGVHVHPTEPRSIRVTARIQY